MKLVTIIKVIVALEVYDFH